MDKQKAYLIERALHWGGSFLILIMLMSMYSAIHTTNWQVKGADLHRQDAIELHSFFALLLAFFLLARIIWKKINPNIEARSICTTRLHKTFVYTIHTALYLALGTLFITGLIMSQNYEVSFNFLGLWRVSSEGAQMNLFEQANQIHKLAIDSIYYLIAIHIAGSLYSRK